jgi:hypothetical protein
VLAQRRSPAMATPGVLADVEVIPKPDLRVFDDFVVYWNGKRAGRMAPRPTDIEPSELAGHFPNTFVVDVLDGGADFRYRFIGKHLIESVARDSTGQKVSSLYCNQPEALAKVAGVFRHSVIQKCPIYIRGRIFWLPVQDHRNFAAALVPLSEDGFAVSAILAELFVLSKKKSRG